MPSIIWIKNDDALAVQSNNWTRVAEIFLDDEQIHSKLVIKGVKREDDGKYYCFANNSAGEKASKPAFLSTKYLGETYALFLILALNLIVKRQFLLGRLWKYLKEMLSKGTYRKCFRTVQLNTGHMYHEEQRWGNSFQISRSCSLKVGWGCMLI